MRTVWFSLLLLSSHILVATYVPPIKIGIPLSLTGKFAVEALELKHGYDLWAKIVNAAPSYGILVDGKKMTVELVYRDDQSDKELNAQVTEKLIIEDKVNFLFGPYATEMAEMTKQVAQKHKVLIINSGASADSLFQPGSYIFSTLIPASHYAESTLEYLSKNTSLKSLVIVQEEDNFSRAVTQGAQKKAKELGIEIKKIITTPSFGAMVEINPVTQTQAKHSTKQKFVEELKSLNADGLLAAGHFFDDERFLWAMHEIDYHPAALIMVVGPTLQKFMDKNTQLGQGIVVPSQWFPTLQYRDTPDPSGNIFVGTAQDYARRFEAEYGSTAGYLNGAASAAGLVLQRAIEKARSIDTNKVREQLMKLSTETFYGPIDLDKTGKRTNGAMMVLQLQNINGSLKKVLLGPVNAQVKPTGKLLYPKPWPEKKEGN